MRDTLENLYFGNIAPNDQIVKSETALKKAMEQSAECEEKLTALLEDKEKTLLPALGPAPRRHRPRAWPDAGAAYWRI